MASLWYHFAKNVMKYFFKIFYRHQTLGKKGLYRGGAIIAPNHVSHLDPIAVGASWPRALHYFARDTLFDPPARGKLLRSIQVHPIARGEADIGSMKKILAYLKEGEQVVLFPEGTRSPNGELQEGQMGVAMLAIRADVPIIPVYVAGTYEIWGKGRKFPKLFGKVRTIIGNPIFPKEFAHLDKHQMRQAMIDATMKALHQMQKSGEPV
ncbi:MAG: 1-acyl-sn-glycerol-3-phosphate acyltransferase [Verrucomicrobia bacterium]|nr:1-acyl-sn-glycerol-3-phosphate acyltransferase [Verrucomicrobiota bacterium]